MRILGIETSCDETAAAVWSEGRILSNIVFSQTEHIPYGGVVPELASRAHLRRILPVVQEALTSASTSLAQLDGIAVTQGPGLVGSLLVGLSVAKSLSFSLDLPLVGVHHIEGHLFAGYLEHPELKPPFVALVASGGHTQLLSVPQMGRYRLLGATLDDAAGEAFDKVAKMLGIGYPGGPAIAAWADRGDPATVRFPRAHMGDSLDFSFSGLKTAVMNHVRRLSPQALEGSRADIAASFQMAVVDVLVEKSLRAVESERCGTLLVAGGVAANRLLRETLRQEADTRGLSTVIPAGRLCTDNAAMIAAAGAFRLAAGERADLDLNADPRLKLGDVS
jgi:N6-L-threonylcarbamoyladenine synthase